MGAPSIRTPDERRARRSCGEVAEALDRLDWRPVIGEGAAARYGTVAARVADLLALPETPEDDWYRRIAPLAGR